MMLKLKSISALFQTSAFLMNTEAFAMKSDEDAGKSARQQKKKAKDAKKSEKDALKAALQQKVTYSPMDVLNALMKDEKKAEGISKSLKMMPTSTRKILEKENTIDIKKLRTVLKSGGIKMAAIELGDMKEFKGSGLKAADFQRAYEELFARKLQEINVQPILFGLKPVAIAEDAE